MKILKPHFNWMILKINVRRIVKSHSCSCVYASKYTLHKKACMEQVFLIMLKVFSLIQMSLIDIDWQCFGMHLQSPLINLVEKCFMCKWRTIFCCWPNPNYINYCLVCQSLLKVRLLHHGAFDRFLFIITKMQ